MIGKSITIIIPAEKQVEFREIMERLRRGEHIDHFETVRLHKDGTPLDVSITISPLKDEKGYISGAATIARDITRRKHLEETLRQSLTRATALIDANIMGVVIADMDGMRLSA